MKAAHVILAALVVLGLATAGSAQQSQQPQQPVPPEMAAWIKAATPGPNHQFLASMAGKWNVAVRFWAGPKAVPQESTGTMTSEVVLGGRYVMDHYHGDMMGQPFEGIGLSGYDNLKGKFVSTWADNASTAIMVSEGTYDPKSKTMTMESDFTDPMTGKTKRMRTVTHLESETRHVMDFFEPAPDGTEFKSMEMVYTRQ